MVELLKLIWGSSCQHDQNNDKIYAVVNSLRAPVVNYQRNNLNANILPNIPCLLDEEVKKMFSKGLEIANKDEVRQQRSPWKERLLEGYF